MIVRISRLLLAGSLGPLLSAQAGNEILFVGTGMSGSTDPYFLIESSTGTTVANGGIALTDNIRDAVWADSGRSLYVVSRQTINVAQWNGSAPQWSVLWNAGNNTDALELDAKRKRLWVSVYGQLICIDVDTQSPTYGTQIALANGASLAGASWTFDLADLGDLAAVKRSGQPQSGGDIALIDLDPASATYLQVISTLSVPGTGLFVSIVAVAISREGNYVYAIRFENFAGRLFVHDVTAGAWLDFDAAPGVQGLLLASPTTTFAISDDRSFGLFAGAGGGSSHIERIDFDYANPTQTTSTLLPLPPGTGGTVLTISPEQSRCAIGSSPNGLNGPSLLTVLEVASGTVQQTVSLPNAWNIYAAAWQDESSVASYDGYGSGCAGRIGVPALSASSTPVLGTTLTIDVHGLANDIAVMASGLSRQQTTAGLPLPFDLTIIGMPGCQLHTDTAILDLIAGVGGTAQWTWSVPNTPPLVGARFYQQAFSLDPLANSLGLAASAGGVAKLGF